MSARTLIAVTAIMLVGFAVVMILVMSVSKTARWQSFSTEDDGEPGPSGEATNNAGGSIPENRNSSYKKGTLRFAIAPVISPENSYVSYKKLVDFVASQLNREGQIITRESYEDTNELLRNEKCDVALICTYSYLLGRREFGAKLLAAPVVDGAKNYHSYFIVSRDSKYNSIEELQGKTYAYADDISTSGWLYLAVWLKNHAFDPMSFFSERTRTGSHDSSIHEVADKDVASAAVDSIVFEHMPANTKKRVRIIHKSPAFGMPPLVTPSNIDESFRKKLLEVILSLHETSRGEQLLKDLRIDKFREVEHIEYDSVQGLLDQWESEGKNRR